MGIIIKDAGGQNPAKDGRHPCLETGQDVKSDVKEAIISSKLNSNSLSMLFNTYVVWFDDYLNSFLWLNSSLSTLTSFLLFLFDSFGTLFVVFGRQSDGIVGREQGSRHGADCGV